MSGRQLAYSISETWTFQRCFANSKDSSNDFHELTAKLGFFFKSRRNPFRKDLIHVWNTTGSFEEGYAWRYDCLANSCALPLIQHPIRSLTLSIVRASAVTSCMEEYNQRWRKGKNRIMLDISWWRSKNRLVLYAYAFWSRHGQLSNWY